MSKVFLIVGSNTGIGFELVRLLAEQKHTVYVSAHNEVSGKDALEKLHSEGVTNVKLVLLDVTKPPTIEAACSTIYAAEGRLDVLVNNAGVSMFGTDQSAPSASVDGLGSAMETNSNGVVQDTTALFPIFRKSESPVILNISSELASNTFIAHPDPEQHFVAYNASKAAASTYSIVLAHKLKEEGVRVNAATPEYMSTKLNNHNAGGVSVSGDAESLCYALTHFFTRYEWGLIETRSYRQLLDSRLNYPSR